MEQFLLRLSAICGEYDRDDESQRRDLGEKVSRSLGVVANSLCLLEKADCTFDQLISRRPGLLGTEHLVELDILDLRVSKITRPPAFGLEPYVRKGDEVIQPSGKAFSQPGMIEMRHGSALGYLERWVESNRVFGDDVRLNSVIEWSDGTHSFGVTQPLRGGTAASDSEILKYFLSQGWDDMTRRAGRAAFYHFGWNLLAVDVEPRNCFIHDETVFPFDVVLSQPDSRILEFLELI